MRKIFFLLFTLAVLPTYAQQRINAYVSLGATAAQIEGDELKGFKKWGTTAGVGAMTSLSKGDKWMLGIEADFAQRGSYNISNNPYSIRLQMNYVDIPVTLYFHDPKGGMYFGAGLSYGRLVQQPHDIIRFPEGFVPDTSDMSFLKSDLCWLVEGKFTIWRGLQFSLRYQASLLPIKENWGFTETINGYPQTRYNNCYNQAISLRLIWLFGGDKSFRGR